MSLDEELKKMFETGRVRILAVDSDSIPGSEPSVETSVEVSDLRREAEEYARKYGVDIEFLEPSEDGSNVEKPDLIVLRAPEFNPLNYVVTLVANIAHFNGNVKDKPMIVYIPPDERYGGEPLSPGLIDALRKTTGVFFDMSSIELLGDYNKDRFPSIMHLLHGKITGSVLPDDINGSIPSAHSYRDTMWRDKYLGFIDESLRAGNNQTSMDYEFLILSDREVAYLADEISRVGSDEKVKVEDSRYELNDKDIERCACIFIDNHWNHLVHDGPLGDGIDTLVRIREQLDSAGINISIIYQSGHDLSSFTDEEVEEMRSTVQRYGAVLAAKDLFPKVCKGKEVAEKESEIVRIAQNNPALARYLPVVYDLGDQPEGRDGFYVTCTRIVDEEQEPDIEKLALFGDLGLEDNSINHRMYVLAQFHTTFKDEVDNPDLRATSVDYFDFDLIKEKLQTMNGCDSEEQLEELRAVYDSVVARHRSMTPTTIAHNDAKWDNWFAGKVLGDFGSAQAGTEYKDIAKAVIDPDTQHRYATCEEDFEQAIDTYISIRSTIDPEFSVGDRAEFVKNVNEMLLTESLRTMYYKVENTEFAAELRWITRRAYARVKDINLDGA